MPPWCDDEDPTYDDGDCAAHGPSACWRASSYDSNDSDYEPLNPDEKYSTYFARETHEGFIDENEGWKPHGKGGVASVKFLSTDEGGKMKRSPPKVTT